MEKMCFRTFFVNEGNLCRFLRTQPTVWCIYVIYIVYFTYQLRTERYGMDNTKTGKLIKELRTAKGMTQKQLADKLHITDRAVSKWERGLCSPDISLLEPLSDILEVKITDLISGEKSVKEEISVEEKVLDAINYSENELKKKTNMLKSMLFVVSIFACVIMIYQIGVNAMWIFFGISAIVTALLNVIWTVWNRDAKWFRFISLAFTAFTVCTFYGQAGEWAARNDWSALEDVLPGVSNALWFLTVMSVVINSISLFKKS